MCTVAMVTGRLSGDAPLVAMVDIVVGFLREIRTGYRIHLEVVRGRHKVLAGRLRRDPIGGVALGGVPSSSSAMRCRVEAKQLLSDLHAGGGARAREVVGGLGGLVVAVEGVGNVLDRAVRRDGNVLRHELLDIRGDFAIALCHVLTGEVWSAGPAEGCSSGIIHTHLSQCITVVIRPHLSPVFPGASSVAQPPPMMLLLLGCALASPCAQVEVGVDGG